MALQLHKLFVSGCCYGNFSNSSRVPIMAQCKIVQNYSAFSLTNSPFAGGYRFKSVGTCRVTGCQLRYPGFKVERNFSMFRTVADECTRVSAFSFSTQLGVSMKQLTHKFSESSFGLSSFLYKCAGRRFFTVKANQKLQVPRKLISKDNKVANTERKVRPLLMAFHKLPREKSVTVHCSPDEGIQVASGLLVKKRAQKTKAAVAKTVVVSSNKEKVVGDVKKKSVSKKPVKTSATKTRKAVTKDTVVLDPGKQVNEDIKLGSSVSTTSKSKKTSTPGKLKPQLEKSKEKQLLSSDILSGAKKTKGSKKLSQAKKLHDSNGGVPSSTLESTSVGETNLPTDVDNSLERSQSKKKSVSSSTKKKPRDTKVRTKSDMAATKQSSSPVCVEVNQYLSGRTIGPLYPPSGKSVMVVESLTKSKVIQGYLGDMFVVLPSYGHVRDLAGRSGSVRPDDNFSMVWEVPSAAWTHLKSIKVALKGATTLILASDPDREGEAIAWHIIEMLQQEDAIHKNLTVARVVFHEITEASIKEALQAPRDIDSDLVHAYLARRALDYLIGFNISPLLWRKLPGCQSAGRVQSAALALVCDREMEIDAFKPQEYWSVEVEFKKEESGKSFHFPSHLTHLECRKLEQLSISSSAEAKDIEHKITTSSFEVIKSKRSKTRKNPPPPYITSTLQQDAANKFHFPASYTMKLAQKLYEGVKLSDGEATGLITYMRTDGLHVSDGAAENIRSLVIERYGKDFASETTRKYLKKVKNAQEAHEAIRPTNIYRLPSMLAGVLDEDSMKLYTLIWSRTMACQMEPSVIDQVQVDTGSAEESLVLRSTCSRVGFLGYQAVYKDGESAAVGYKEKEGNLLEEAFNLLSTLKSGDKLYLGKVELKQHFTQPPSRYSEGSLVKKLEELGIGRPSTYATTMKVLQDRSYLTVKSRILHPEFRGRMVSAFLSHHFAEVTDYSFTADMETELDNISAGITEWKGLLKDYWARFSSYCEAAGSIDSRQVEKMLEGVFGDLVFSSLPGKSRTCPSCSTGSLIFKVSRYGEGYFIGCDQHPRCKYIAKASCDDDEEGVSLKTMLNEPKVLGVAPASEEKVLLKNGPFGFYVQLGEDRKGYVPKRASVSKMKDVSNITLEEAIEILRYPINLGKHPEDGKPVDLKLARFGFSVAHQRRFAPVPKDKSPQDVTLEEALKLLSGKDVKQPGRPKSKPKLKQAV